MKPISQTPVKQRGAALAIGLILLAVTSLVTVTAINTGVMQERMSANQDNHARAFMAAEAGGAALLSWINTSGWRNATTPTPPLTPPRPPDGNLDGRNPPIITYTMTLQSASWNASPLNVRIDGFARSADGSAVLARTQLLVSLERQTVPTPGAPPPTTPSASNAPAAISCFGSSCRIRAGAGQGADEGFGTVSGFDHPIPPLNCSGNRCRLRPHEPDSVRTQTPTAPVTAMPAVFLSNPNNSSIDVQGGGNPFQGLHPTASNPIITITGNGITVAKSPSHYPDDPNGASTVPVLESIIGSPVPPATRPEPTTRLESGRSTPTFASGPPHNVTAEVGRFVINGGSFEMKGNELFVGLIVIRNCGTLTMRGNPNIYGAVVVDATGCPPSYAPFGGSGTPAVRFSRAALERAANPPGTGTGTGPGTGTGTTQRLNVLRWVEILE